MNELDNLCLHCGADYLASFPAKHSEKCPHYIAPAKESEPGKCKGCDRVLPVPEWDLKKAEKMTVDQIRKAYPRLDHLCECGSRTIIYASYAQYLYGDY